MLTPRRIALIRFLSSSSLGVQACSPRVNSRNLLPVDLDLHVAAVEIGVAWLNADLVQHPRHRAAGSPARRDCRAACSCPPASWARWRCSRSSRRHRGTCRRSSRDGCRRTAAPAPRVSWARGAPGRGDAQKGNEETADGRDSSLCAHESGSISSAIPTRRPICRKVCRQKQGLSGSGAARSLSGDGGARRRTGRRRAPAGASACGGFPAAPSGPAPTEASACAPRAHARAAPGAAEQVG